MMENPLVCLNSLTGNSEMYQDSSTSSKLNAEKIDEDYDEDLLPPSPPSNISNPLRYALLITNIKLSLLKFVTVF